MVSAALIINAAPKTVTAEEIRMHEECNGPRPSVNEYEERGGARNGSLTGG
jgi:hypothetical protein